MGVLDNLVAKCMYLAPDLYVEVCLNPFNFTLHIDIATGVGFYAVSIPFFDKNNKLLTDNADGERLRVSYSWSFEANSNNNKGTLIPFRTLIQIWNLNIKHQIFSNTAYLSNSSTITHSAECLSNWPRLLVDWFSPAAKCHD